MNVYESIRTGLEEAIAYANGDLSKGHETNIALPDPVELSFSDIRQLRSSSGLTQRGFADFLGVSVRTVEAWESGVNTPSGPARRIMSFIRSDPDFIKKYS